MIRSSNNISAGFQVEKKQFLSRQENNPVIAAYN